MALPPPTIDTTVLVTGASSGIGAELARELAGRAYNVVLVARRADRLEALAEEPRLTHGIHADVEPCALFHESDVEREQQVVRLNVDAVHHLTGAFLDRMVRDGAGAILNVGSTAAFQPLPGFATYAASKAFVQSFSEAVHAELGGTGVSVTTLSPGFTRTEFGEVANASDKEAAMPGFLFMQASDVARVGVEAMVAGRRTAIPGLKNRASMIGGRMAPRSLMLPLVRQV